MADKIEIDGWMCDVIETGYKYENLVPVRKGNLTGCWYRKQKCLDDGWRDTNETVYGRSYTGRTSRRKR